MGKGSKAGSVNRRGVIAASDSSAEMPPGNCAMSTSNRPKRTAGGLQSASGDAPLASDDAEPRAGRLVAGDEGAHSDTEPDLVARDGAVKILDMGLARFFNDEEDILTRKFDENVLGTADYLAPEQAIDSHTVDIRADIYGLGATFYFMLTGKYAYDFPPGNQLVGLMKILEEDAVPISKRRGDVPEALARIIHKALAREPSERYPDAETFRQALLPFMT